MSRFCGLTGLHHSVRYYRARRPRLRLQVPGKLGGELGQSISGSDETYQNYYLDPPQTLSVIKYSFLLCY